jgi:hypothetical protein
LFLRHGYRIDETNFEDGNIDEEESKMVYIICSQEVRKEDDEKVLQRIFIYQSRRERVKRYQQEDAQGVLTYVEQSVRCPLLKCGEKESLAISMDCTNIN